MCSALIGYCMNGVMIIYYMDVHDMYGTDVGVDVDNSVDIDIW